MLAKTHDDDAYEPTQSGVFPVRERSPRQTADRRRDADRTLEWLERRFARRYEGDATLARLAQDHDAY
jgi:hypothetical protein